LVPSSQGGLIFVGVYPLLRLWLLGVSPLRRLTFLQAPKKVSKKRWAPAFGPLAGARGSFVAGFIRGDRLRFAALHLLSICSTASNGAARLPPDESLHSACRRGLVDQDQELQPS
jgi:hypothetical protein